MKDKKEEMKEQILEDTLENEKSSDIENDDSIIEGEVEADTNCECETQNSNKLEEELFKIKSENTKLSNELEALKDRLLRLDAEYENYRKRTQKEKEGIYKDACQDVLKEMFPVLDNLERAISIDGSYEDLKKGIDMTIRQFQNGFTKLGVEEISVEEGFDPNYHQAVMHVEDPNLGQNAVAEVLQKGYKKGDKVLRFTMVKVAN